MRGLRTLWLPGTDHAGIATQTVVEKRLKLEGVRRVDLGRAGFQERAMAWKDEYEGVILGQLRDIGCSCDWARTRFTMDEVCTAAVRAAFFRLFDEDLIYRGKRLVNWDPVTQTALADDEVEMQEVDGHMWYLRYPLEDGSGHVTVATTRPETMLGDTAVAINPNDPRAAALKGMFVTLPVVGRRIPIVEDDHVIMSSDQNDPKAAFATGFLKVTPAHDVNDWDIGLRHDLPVINVLGPDGAISDQHGWTDVSSEAVGFVGLSREDARTAIVDWFKAQGLLEEIRDYTHSVGHSYRSHVPIERWLSDQWYVRVTDDRLRGEALRAMDNDQYEGTRPKRRSGTCPGDGGLRFTPARYARTFQAWHENLRDWCISRQLWWGHRIPVWTLEVEHPCATTLDESLQPVPKDNGLPMADAQGDSLSLRMQRASDSNVRMLACVAGDAPEVEAAVQEAGFQQDEDVLDTWFSSALWPMSTMGWPDPAAFEDMDGMLDTFNPTNVLCTAREIITLWVSRMVMFNRYFRNGTLPFTDVTIHPMVQDGFGQKMSKSLGNGVDPRDIIKTHGTDALRLVMTQIATATQDVRLPVDLIDPHSGQTFSPEIITSPSGHRVAAPVQRSPKHSSKTMATVYGVLTGLAEVTDDQPLAGNSSSRFDAGRNFASKLWNAVRFALGRVKTPCGPDGVGDIDSLPDIDRWMLSRLAHATADINGALGQYQFNVFSEVLYDLIWRDLCDWYLEAIKHTVDEDSKQQQVLLSVLDATLRLLHPVCPFVTETAWAAVQAKGASGTPMMTLEGAQLLAVATWPDPDESLLDAQLEDDMNHQRHLLNSIRSVRSDRGLPGSLRPALVLDPALHAAVGNNASVLCTMGKLSRIDVQKGDPGQDAVPVACDGGTASLIELGEASAGADDGAQRRMEALQGRVAALEGRLGNAGYVDKAPAKLVEETRQQLAQAVSELEQLKSASHD